MRHACILMITLLFPSIFIGYNPFTPPEKVQILYQVLYPDAVQSSVEYKMYIQQKDKILALLNTVFVSEGDSFEGMKVIKITTKYVVLLDPSGKKYFIAIDAMQSNIQKLRDILNAQKNTSIF